MELAKLIQSILTGGLTSYAVALIALSSVLFKVAIGLTKALEFHDKHFVRKPIARLRALRQAANKQPELADFLDSAIQAEAFRLATRIDTSRAKREYLLALAQKGVWSNPQLRSVSKFLMVVPGQVLPALVVSRLDIAGAYIGLFATLSIVLVGGAHSLALVFSGDPFFMSAGVLASFMFLLAVRFYATDFIDWLIVKRVQQYLASEAN